MSIPQKVGPSHLQSCHDKCAWSKRRSHVVSNFGADALHAHLCDTAGMTAKNWQQGLLAYADNNADVSGGVAS